MTTDIYSGRCGKGRVVERFSPQLITRSVCPESLDGFGTKDFLETSLQSMEERCSVYSIIGSSVLRYGTVPASSLELSLVSKEGNRKKSPDRSRAQTVTVNRKSRPDSSGSVVARVSVL